MADDGSGRLGLDRLADTVGKKPFPLHSTFFLGELALFAFVGLVTTGIFLAFFYEPSTRAVELAGQQVPAAYASVVRIDGLTVGRLARRVHHWSAHVMIAAVVAHMARIYFTGAYKKPRDINWLVGAGLLGLTIGEGFVGYLLPFDEFAVTATGIGYGIVSSVPWIGSQVAELAFAGPFPNQFTVPRFYGWHIMLLPGLLAGLVGLHLAILFRLKHTQHPEVTERIREVTGLSDREGVLGQPFWPEQTVVMAVLFLGYATGVVLLAALVPVHPVEANGPPTIGTPAMKPDWYLLWVFGILKLVPSVSVTVLGGTFNAEFVGGVLIPGAVGGLIVAVPFLDAKLTGDASSAPPYATTQRLGDRPGRTAAGAGAVAFFLLASLAGYTDTIGVPVDLMAGIVIGGTLLAGVATYLALRGRSFAGRYAGSLRDD